MIKAKQMKQSKKPLSLLSLSVISLIFIALLFSGCSLESSVTGPGQEGALSVHFLDVGQADSILIKTDSAAMLIDGGNNADADMVVAYLQEQGITRLDYLIGTHPHEDHIGGLDAVIDEFDIGKVLMPKVQSNTKTFESLLTAIKNKGLRVTTAKAGLQFDLGPDVNWEILSPNYDHYDDVNDYSAIVRLTYGDTSFLFTGDAGFLPEEEMLAKGYNLQADVLKVGHHGSRYATSEEFLETVAPEYAVISVGADNSYGHPHKEALDRLEGIEVFRTDRDGTVIITSDGDDLAVKKVNEK